MGCDAVRRAVLPDAGAPARRLPGPRNLPLLALVQPVRRRASRRARSEDAAVTQQLLDIRDLSVRFETDHGTTHAVHRMSFTLAPCEFLGFVGESGCGKSVTTMALLQLLPPSAVVTGQVLFGGTELLRARGAELRRIRGREIAFVFQEPMTSLNPSFTIGRQIGENLSVQFVLSK